MPSELGLHRVGNLALLQLEDDLFELRNHLTVAEVAEIAAVVLRARILRVFLRELGEIRAFVELRLELFGLLFGFDQDMACRNFLFRLQKLHLIVIDLARIRVADRTLDDLLEIQLSQRPALEIGEARFEVGTLIKLGLFARFGKKLVVDEEFEQRGALLRPGHRAHVAADFAFRDGEIALRDRLPVDGGDDLILREGLHARRPQKRDRKCDRKGGREDALHRCKLRSCDEKCPPDRFSAHSCVSPYRLQADGPR